MYTVPGLAGFQTWWHSIGLQLYQNKRRVWKGDLTDRRLEPLPRRELCKYTQATTAQNNWEERKDNDDDARQQTKTRHQVKKAIMFQFAGWSIPCTSNSNLNR